MISIIFSAFVVLGQSQPESRSLGNIRREETDSPYKGSKVVFISKPPVSGSATEFVIENVMKLEKALEPDKSLSEKEMKTKDPLVKSIVSSVLDLDSLGRFALSSYWEEVGKTAKGKQQRVKYQTLFKMLVEENYLQKVRHYIGGHHHIHFTSEEVKDGKAKILARIRKSDVDVLVEFDAEKRGQSWKVIDTKLDDTSLQETYRSSFGRIIRKHGGVAKGLPELLQAMDRRLAELQSGKGTQL